MELLMYVELLGLSGIRPVLWSYLRSSLSDYFLLISKIGPKDGSLLKVMQIRTHDKLLF